MLTIMCVVLAGQRTTVAQCAPHWSQAIGNPGFDNNVTALASFDDGSGPALYAGGIFTTAGNTVTRGIARWNGSAWAGVGGSGVNVSGIYAIVPFDDGSGPALYVGGFFNSISGVTAQSVARWNGSSWSALGSGVAGSVYTMCVFNDGSGPALYVGGNFASAGGVPASQVARWNGSSWSALGTGVDDQVYCMKVFDDGNGPALYVGGVFNHANGGSIAHLAKWNGTSFAPVGSLGAVATDHPHTLLPFKDGGLIHLFAGGFFFFADGQPARNVARWTGANWLPMANGFNGEPKASDLFDDRTGAGPQVFMGGDFTQSGLAPVVRATKWNGSNWEPLGAGMNFVIDAAAVHDFGLGAGPSFYVGGHFTTADGQIANHIAQWVADGRPTITRNPISTAVIAGQPASFTASAIGSPALVFQWRRDGVPLSDGGPVSGAATTSLVISPATQVESGNYDLLITNPCGSATTFPALLSVQPACPGDLFADTRVDARDIPGFITCLLSGQSCSATDLDADGQNANLDMDDDLAAFITRLLREDTSCP